MREKRARQRKKKEKLTGISGETEEIKRAETLEIRQKAAQYSSGILREVAEAKEKIREVEEGGV